MTSDQIEAVFKEWDAPTQECGSRVLMGTNTPTEVATYRATLEVAYQLALLNEALGLVIQTPIPHIRVMVEPGDYPIQVQERR